MEKLSLYKYKDDTVITSTDIQSCAPVTIDAALDEAINIIADARSDEVGPMLNRLLVRGRILLLYVLLQRVILEICILLPITHQVLILLFQEQGHLFLVNAKTEWFVRCEDGVV
mgnify:CR=1 FL=1